MRLSPLFDSRFPIYNSRFTIFYSVAWHDICCTLIHTTIASFAKTKKRAQLQTRLKGIGQIEKIFKDEEGVTAIEYGLIAFFVAIAIIVFLPGIGDAISTLFSLVASTFQGAT